MPLCCVTLQFKFKLEVYKMLKSNIFLSLLILLTIQEIACDGKVYVDLVCSETGVVKPEWNPALANFPRCVVSSLIVTKPQTIVGIVKRPNNVDMDTSQVKHFTIYTKKRTVLFVPAGIKKKFPKVVSIEIFESGLSHLEREDLRQFGEDLYYIGLWRNPLTVLAGDLFEFNPNLKYFELHEVQLKFIDSQFFSSFNPINLKHVRFETSGCMNTQISDSPTKFQWTYDKCGDEREQNEYLKVHTERESFFFGIFPEIKLARAIDQIEQIVALRVDLKTLAKNLEEIKNENRIVVSQIGSDHLQQKGTKKKVVTSQMVDKGERVYGVTSPEVQAFISELLQGFYSRKWYGSHEEQVNAMYWHILNRLVLSQVIIREIGDELYKKFGEEPFKPGPVIFQDQKSGQAGEIHACHVTRAAITSDFLKAQPLIGQVIAELTAVTENAHRDINLAAFGKPVDSLSEELMKRDSARIDLDEYYKRYKGLIKEISDKKKDQIDAVFQAADMILAHWDDTVEKDDKGKVVVTVKGILTNVKNKDAPEMKKKIKEYIIAQSKVQF